MRAWVITLALTAVCACRESMDPSHLDSVAFDAVSSGQGHTCAATAAGTVYCWGSNEAGEVGARTGDSVNPGPLQVVVGPVGIAKVDAGLAASCALLVGGTPLCWGDGESSPRAPGATLRLAALSVGDFVCGLRADSTAVCWGDLDGAPSAIMDDKFHDLSVGGFACGLAASGAAKCWQRGSAVAVPVPGGIAFTALSVGDRHACGLLGDGRIFCWGDNSAGQLGDFTTASRDAPAEVAGTRRYLAVAAGGSHTCAIAEDHEAYCWGEARSGQLGYGGNPPTYGEHITAPTRVRGGDLPDAPVWTGISAGAAHSCGTMADGHVYCWGANARGELGDGTTELRAQPVRVGAAS